MSSLPSGAGRCSRRRPYFGSVPQGEASGQPLPLSFKDAPGRALQFNLVLLQGEAAAGLDPVTATQRAYAATAGIVQRQAAMISFVEVFRMLGVMFLCLLPLVLLMNRPGSNKH